MIILWLKRSLLRSVDGLTDLCPRPKHFKMFTSQVLIIHNASAVFLNSLSVAAERIRTLPATFHVELKPYGECV